MPHDLDDGRFRHGTAPEQVLVSPFVVRYDGRAAKRSVMDAQGLGTSLVGGARLYSAVAHYCFFGEVPGRRYTRQFTCFAQPARAGSWDQFFYLAPLLGQYQLHASLFNEAFSYIFGRVTDTLTELWTRPSETQAIVERLATTIEAVSRDNAQVQQQLAAGLMRSNELHASVASQLIATLPALAGATRPAATQFVEPVGRTCESITQFVGGPSPVMIGQAEAQTIRSGRSAEVKDVATYQVERVLSLNLNTGACTLDVAELGRVRGRITDPALQIPGNPYTQALNAHLPLAVDAKAVTIDGEIRSLYISTTKNREP